MEKFLIYGGKELNGKVKILSAKNSVLPILSASIMCKDKVVLKNIPKIKDIENMCEILVSLGCKVSWKNRTLTIDSRKIDGFTIPCELSSKLRASIFMLGSLVGLFKKAKICQAGGCNIGNRPIDIHLDGLKKMGVDVQEMHGYVFCDAKEQKATNYYLRFQSVGATENLMMASVFVKGTTILNNCAKEPEIVDLQNFLNKMGAKISGAGTEQIKIVGVKKLHGVSYKPIGDRIVAGTFVLATMMCGGDVEISNIKPSLIESLLELISSNDCKILCNNDKILISCHTRSKSILFVETNPYPLFPTDLQAQLMAFETVCDGTSVIIENMFETRFKHIAELKKMGADIKTKNNIAIITGKEQLLGAEVCASDLRAGACLVLAGLKAKGYTTINDIYHIDRGYESLEKDFQKLGADIKRVDV